MPNKVSLCLIRIEIIHNSSCVEEGAVSSEHPTNPRVQRERERDRGLRVATEITIETYTNKLWLDHDSPRKHHQQPEPAAKMSEINGEGAMAATADSRQWELRTSISGSRETTPLEDGQAPPEFPKEISFFAGNPSVEITNGIIHLYKKNERKELKEGPSSKLCLLAVPATLNCHDILNFVAPCMSDIQHVRIVREGSPNQFMVLMEFRTNQAALEFYQTFNGAAYNSLEPDSVCHAVWVVDVEHADDGMPPLGHTELPTCPVCLERMDESVDGVLTILCNHVFHANCLVKWGDSTCPVCRHVQTPELVEDSVCMECEGTDSLWICLICGHVGCGRYQGGHAAAHYRATNHTFALQLGTSSVWDYAGDNFVHRLFQNKTDGKLVASGRGTNNDDCGEEKIDSMQLEFTYLLTSQLDSQRKYYEERMLELEEECREQQLRISINESQSHEQDIQVLLKEKQALERKLAQNAAKLKDANKQLSEEHQLSKAMQDNQSSWHTKCIKMEEEHKKYREEREAELASLKEQLRDIMFYMEAQTQIAQSELQSEIVEGTVILPEASGSNSAGKRGQRNKKKSR